MGIVYTKDVGTLSVLFSLLIIKIPNILVDFLKAIRAMYNGFKSYFQSGSN